MPHPIISTKCTGKEACLKQAMEICPVDVFAEEDGKVIVKHPSKCIGCRACEAQCENNEIKVVD